MSKKYELVRNETIDGLARIRALRDIPESGVKAGDLGGYIKSERNLSHDGDCWVSDNARVSGEARVYDNAYISGYAYIFDNARVFNNALVSGDAHVYGNAYVYGDVTIRGDSRIKTERDYCVFSRVGSENGVLTVCKGETELFAAFGRFTGTLDEFEAAVNQNSNEQIKKEYALLIQFARLRLGGAV